MILVDGMMLVHRCISKMDEFCTTSKGQPTGLEFGFLRTIQSIQKKLNDTNTIICWDNCTNWRHNVSAEYKATRRRLDKSSLSRLETFKRFLQQVYTVAEGPSLEADDVMHTLAHKSANAAEHTYIYTNDKDLLQSVTDCITVVKSFKSQLYMWTPSKVFEKYGVEPHLLYLYLTFIGDAVDNIPGISRINKKLLSRIITWCDRYGYVNDASAKSLTFDWYVARELISGDFNQSTKDLLKSFCGVSTQTCQFKTNIELIKLTQHDGLIVQKPTGDEDYIKQCLETWEVFSLDICKQYTPSMLSDDEEF